MPSSSVFSLAGRVVAAASTIMLIGPPAAAETGTACLRPPVVAPVIDPFRAPACTWCPGNRGIDYGTLPHTLVRAAAAGQVTFVGPVAGISWVTLGHAGGLSSTYGPMANVVVQRGDAVLVGQALGTTVGPLHFGVRLDGRYLDPASLLGRPPHLVPRLVPLRAHLPPVPTLRCVPGLPGSPVR